MTNEQRKELESKVRIENIANYLVEDVKVAMRKDGATEAYIESKDAEIKQTAKSTLASSIFCYGMEGVA